MAKPAMAAPKGLPYGGQKQLLDAQRAVPVAPPPSQTGGGGGGPQAAPQGPQGPMPGGLGDIFRSTERPDEPLTTGAPAGPGAGPEMFQGAHPFADDMDAKLRGLYLRFPMPELRDLLDDMDII